ncbi:MAG: hypothetical protein JNM17_16635 [Archangium sp.]|nr:hypothetical protein [Archangium sp.]
MNRERAVEKLNRLGFRGPELYLAELIPAVEMAWADGVVGPNELAILEAYCEALVESLNRQVGARLFTLDRALKRMHRLVERRLTPAERQLALEALRDWSSGETGAAQRKRMVEWAQAVAAVDGSPVWDTRELFWLQRVCTMLEVH